MIQRIRTALFKHIYPIAYLALVFAACALHVPAALPFFSFFAPIVAVGGLFFVAATVLLVQIRFRAPDMFNTLMANAAAALRGQSLLSRCYAGLHSTTIFVLLIAAYHPFYAFCHLLVVAAAVLWRWLLARVPAPYKPEEGE